MTYGLMTIINKTLGRSIYTFVREQNLNMSINHELNTAHVSNYKNGGCSIFHVVSTNIFRVFNKAVRILTTGINHKTVSLNYTGLILIINLQTGLLLVSLYGHLKEQSEFFLYIIYITIKNFVSYDWKRKSQPVFFNEQM